MIRKQLAVWMLATAFILPATTTLAAESSVNVALTSNYIFRGQTLSNDNMALQGGFDIAQSKDRGWYAGAFVSMFDQGPGGEDGLETDIFAGWKGSFGAQSNFGWDAGVILYEYQGANNVKGQFEIFAGINYETAYLKLYIGDDDNRVNGDYTYLEGEASFVVLKDIDLDLHVGHTSRDFARDYFDARATLKKKVNGFDTAVSLTYESLGDEMEFLVTVGKSFDL